MADTNTLETENTAQNGSSEENRPDWVIKAPRSYGDNSRLERIGAAWNREDGGIGVRLTGKQIVESDIFLYPNQKA